MDKRAHEYEARLIWAGNTGSGTASYTAYDRNFRVCVPGKPDLAGSADPAFRGDPGVHNPEDLFVAAIAACHMLFYLALCARRGVRVVGYEDRPSGRMAVGAGGVGRFEQVTLRPRVTIEGAEGERLARALHHDAHEQCFIANSCCVAIRHEASITALAEAAGDGV